MTTITVYDYEADRIKEICEEKNVTEAQVIEALFSMMDWHDEDDLGEYM